jgi:hypothetical protein
VYTGIIRLVLDLNDDSIMVGNSINLAQIWLLYSFRGIVKESELLYHYERPREAPTYVYPAKILIRALKSAIILVVRLVT